MSRLIALVGMPNSGKTSLFNALTGSRQKVANYPGVTVEKREGVMLRASHKGDAEVVTLLDLPGVYSLSPKTPDEQVAIDVLGGKHLGEKRPDAVLVVLDPTRFEQSLRLALELRKVEVPRIFVFHLQDIVRSRGMQVDLRKLSQLLGAPVCSTSTVTGYGILELQNGVFQGLFQEVQKTDSTDLYLEVEKIIQQVVLNEGSSTLESSWTTRIDRWILHPVLGVLLFWIVLFGLFQSLFTLAAYPQDWIRSGVALMQGGLQSVMAPSLVRSLLTDGVLAGVGSVVVFLPQILILFLFLFFLEDSGYLARAAFLMDYWMRKAGLHGRAFIPLLSSYACAIPGIMATRTIENPKDRLATILVAPLTTCSARLPVYGLLISVFIPDRHFVGGIGLRGLVLVGLYALGMAAALGVAWILRKTVLAGQKPALILELPEYRMPRWNYLGIHLWDKARQFLSRAGTVILVLSVVVWVLVTFPQTEAGVLGSFAGRVGQWLLPVFRPLGFTWEIVVALIPGMVAREVMVSALSTVYAVQVGAGQSMEAVLSSQWSVATGLSLLIWYVFACQCLSTLAVVRRETKSWVWPLGMFAYMTVLAYGASFLVYQIASW